MKHILFDGFENLNLDMDAFNKFKTLYGEKISSSDFLRILLDTYTQSKDK